MKRFRLKLNNSVYTEPDNWIDFTPTTEKHPIYRTLLTTFSENQVKLIKDAKNYVDEQYALYGTAQTIDVDWEEYDYATNTYSTIMSLGRLNLSTKYSRERDYTSVGFEPNNFVMKLLNRDEITISLQEKIDLDGQSITSFTNETTQITLDNEILDKSFDFKSATETPNIGYEINPPDYTDTVYVPIIANQIDVEELKIKTIGENNQLTPDVPPNTLILQESGNVTIETDITVDIQFSAYNLTQGPDIFLVYTINGGSENIMAQITGLAAVEASPITQGFSDSDTYDLGDLSAGTTLNFYIKIINLSGSSQPDIDFIFDNATRNINIDITQSTEYPDTTVKGMLVWEFFLRLCQKITGRNDCLRSSFFGRTDGEVYTYDEDGEGSAYFISNVKLLRGFPVDNNGIKYTLMKAFKDMNSIYPIGLGITYEGSTPYVTIESLSWWHQRNDILFTVNAEYPGIQWEAATDYIYGQVKCGYNIYKKDSPAVLGTPHSVREYTIPYLSEYTNNVYEATCDMIASGHLIETLRRDRYSDSNNKGGDFDENLFILNVKRDGSNWVRVKDEDFQTINNIDNESTSSNLKITPARNIKNHGLLLLTGLAKRIDNTSLNEFLRFQSGEANIAVETLLTSEITSGSFYLDLNITSGSISVGDQITFTSNSAVVLVTATSGLPAGYEAQASLLSGTLPTSYPEAFTSTGGAVGTMTDSELSSVVTGLTKENADITRDILSETQQNPLWDSSETGVTRVKLTKTQRNLITESIRGVIRVIEGSNQYTGVIQSIKLVNLEESIAEIKFLSTENVPPQFLLLETGNYILQESGGKIKLEMSE